MKSVPAGDQEKHPFEQNPPSQNVPIPPQPAQAGNAADEETPPSSNVIGSPEVDTPFSCVKKLTNALARSPKVLRVPQALRQPTMSCPQPQLLPPQSHILRWLKSSRH